MTQTTSNKLNKGRIDWMITLVPFFLIMGLAVLLFLLPEQSNRIIGQIRFFFGDTLGSDYLIIGLQILSSISLSTEERSL